MKEIINSEREPIFNPEKYSLEEILKPKNCALLIIDPQNSFCHPEGFFARGVKVGDKEILPPRPVAQMAEAVLNIQTLIDTAHAKGVLVIFTKGYEDVDHRTEAGRRRAVKWEEVDKQGREVTETICSKKDSFDAEFFGLKPGLERGDLVIEKYDWSSFTGKNMEGKNLEQILKEKGVRTLVITGVVAETCVETTIRDAYTRDYFIVVPEECIGSDYPDQLKQRLEYWKLGFVGDVLSKKEIEDHWMSSKKT